MIELSVPDMSCGHCVSTIVSAITKAGCTPSVATNG